MTLLWQYLYASSLAISLCIFFGNICMPLPWQLFGNISMHLLCQYTYAFFLAILWQYMYVSSLAISVCNFFGNICMPLHWQYLYASSLAISLHLFFGNISMPLLLQYLYSFSWAISLCLFFGNIVLLLRAFSLCFCEQPYSESAGNLYLLLRAIIFLASLGNVYFFSSITLSLLLRLYTILL